jgi:GNAT superfamily N-acetyltransferase
MLTVKRVDTSKKEIAKIINTLQTEILSDKPANINEGYWWIAYVDGLAVGFCGLVRSAKWSNAGYLCRAGLLSQYTGTGIQKRLIRVRERFAKSIGWAIITTIDKSV